MGNRWSSRRCRATRCQSHDAQSPAAQVRNHAPTTLIMILAADERELTQIFVMNQKEKAETFRSLHVKGSPVILFNIWDAGSARTIEQAGAKAIATGSWSVAAANGFDDGETIPLALVLTNIKRIVDSVAVPVTLDFETGYATDLQGLKDNIR